MKFQDLWGKRWSALTAAAAVGPLATLPAELNPPWPGHVVAVATLLCAFSILLAIVRVRELERNRRLGARRLREGRLSVFAGVGVLLVYLGLFAFLVLPESRPDSKEAMHFVIGFYRTPECAAAGGTDIDRLRDGQYEPSRCWTSGSVAMARWLLVASFGISFALLTYGFKVLARDARK